MLALLPTALAWSPPVGLHTPGHGGAFSGPTEDGVLGVVVNPAAARTGEAELLIDVSLVGSMTHFELDSHPGEPLTGAGMNAIPFLAGVVPLSDHWGLSATVGVPYARGGSTGGEDAANAYFGYATSLLIVEETVGLAVDGWGPVDLGASLRIFQGMFGSTKQYDLGSTLISVLGCDPPAEGQSTCLPLQDPFLTGTLQIGTLRDVGFSAGAGLRVESEDGHGVQLAWKAPVNLELSGPFELQVLNGFNVVVQGETDAEFKLPQEVWLSGEFPLGRLTFGGELGWIDYSTRDGTLTTTRDLVVTTTDTTLDAILGAYGVTSEVFLDAESTQYPLDPVPSKRLESRRFAGPCGPTCVADAVSQRGA